jgi:hypothetical protein
VSRWPAKLGHHGVQIDYKFIASGIMGLQTEEEGESDDFQSSSVSKSGASRTLPDRIFEACLYAYAPVPALCIRKRSLSATIKGR